MIATTRMPVSNTNIIKPMDPSSSITTIIAPPVSFLNNTSIDHINRFPSMAANGTFQQSPFDFSQHVVHNPSQ
jgi:hypothetical protein